MFSGVVAISFHHFSLFVWKTQFTAHHSLGQMLVVPDFFLKKSPLVVNHMIHYTEGH